MRTYFVGNYYEYEANSGQVTKYYYAGAQRVAMRKNGTLNFLLGDHLGSTSLTTDANGIVISEMRYTPWGEVRYSAGVTPTDYTYTGQYSNTADFGLMFYNARWYDPYLGRMAQADTIIPPGVQGLDRYAYVNNSPLNFVDPTGHEPHTPGSCYDSVNGICGYKYSIPKKIKPSIPFVPSYGNGLVGPPTPEGYVTSHTEYMGGASPAGIYEWQDIDGDDDIVDALDAFVTTADMLSPTGDSTLEAYISYITSDDKNVNEISISITNNGESSAILQYIEMSEEALPSFDSCNINTTCIFDPQSPVSIDPGQNATLTICQSCLADGSTIYSYPFNSNQNKYIEVVMVLYTFVDAGLNGVESINLPFIYTIPPR